MDYELELAELWNELDHDLGYELEMTGINRMNQNELYYEIHWTMN